MKNIKELLEKWSQLEPQLCDKAESCFVIRASGNYELIPLNHLFDKHTAWIQWAVQQAIVEKGWYFETRYQPTSGKYQAEVGNLTEHSKNNMAEALLTAYLRVLEAHA